LRYTLRRDGLMDLHIVRADTEGSSDAALVQPIPGSGGSRWKVSRWPELLRALPWAWQDQCVLYVDDTYVAALVGSPQRDALWLLSRHPSMDETPLKARVQLARDRGFATERLHFNGRV